MLIIKEFKKIISSSVNELSLEKKYANQMGVIVDREYGQEILSDFTGRDIFVASPIEKVGSDF